MQSRKSQSSPAHRKASAQAWSRPIRDRNYRVVANSRSIKPSSDPDILAVAGDIADPKTAERIVSAAIERFGRIDTLVNNAGIFIAKPFTEYTDEDFASVLAINVGSFFQVTRRAAAEMLKQGSGHIVQITTSLVDHANSSVPSVLASLTKGGLNAATKSLAIEYASQGHPRERGLAGRHQDADACARDPRVPRQSASGRDAWARPRTSSTPCCSWKARPSSPARFCTSMAARAPATDRTRIASQGQRPCPSSRSRSPARVPNPAPTSVTPKQKAALIKGASELLLDVLKKPLESTFVVIEEVDTDNWGWGGLPALEYRKKRAAVARNELPIEGGFRVTMSPPSPPRRRAASENPVRACCPQVRPPARTQRGLPSWRPSFCRRSPRTLPSR